jgi:hypothetical protein
MKTSVTMIRKIGDFDILQRTKDGYFDANVLISQWNSVEGKKRRRIDDFIKSKTTLDFIEVINSDLANGEISPMAYYIKKGKNTSKGKTKDEIWMHPYLFIDFAMWINPKFKLSVIKFVYDELIKQRTLAADNYLILSTSGVKLKGYNFSEVAKAMQWIVYGKTGKNLRQIATQEQLKELNDIQTKLAFAIDMSYIKSYLQLILEMRKMYKIKHLKSPF